MAVNLECCGDKSGNSILSDLLCVRGNSNLFLLFLATAAVGFLCWQIFQLKIYFTF